MVIKEKQGVAYCWRFILHIIFMTRGREVMIANNDTLIVDENSQNNNINVLANDVASSGLTFESLLDISFPSAIPAGVSDAIDFSLESLDDTFSGTVTDNGIAWQYLGSIDINYTTYEVSMFLVMGLLEFVRTRLMLRMGDKLDSLLKNRVFDAMLNMSLTDKSVGSQPLADLNYIRQFASSQSVSAIFDFPWVFINTIQY